MEIVTQMGCAAGREFEIELALREALANAIEHGSGNDPSKQIECCVACDHERGMLIVVRDPGPGFDPASIPSPVLGLNLFSTGGRGIYLINQLMDEVRFEKGGTEIHMRTHPPAAPAGSSERPASRPTDGGGRRGASPELDSPPQTPRARETASRPQISAGPAASGMVCAGASAWRRGSGSLTNTAAAMTPSRNVAPQRTRAPARSSTTVPTHGPMPNAIENTIV